MLPFLVLMKIFLPSTGFSIPQHTQVLDGETHLWLLDLTELDGSDSEQAIRLLSAHELQRAESFKRRKTEHILTRAFLRKSLARYCHCSAQELSFSVDNNGKPYLTNCVTPLSFNLSHSGDFAVLAISAQKRVGVDIEVIRQRDFMKIAEHYFHPQETLALRGFPHNQKINVFFELWTRKEAFLKALGGGIATGLDKIYFDVSQQPWAFCLADSLNEQVQDWQFFSTRLNEQAFISLAVEQRSSLNVCWFDGARLFVDQ
jgi:4'-phosphopantetheinyl transferase